MGAITVFVADDNVFIREGVKAMLSRQTDIEIVGEAEDFDGLVAGAEAAEPNVVVSDIRMPPNFHNEGIEACKLIRKRHPGTGNRDPQPVRRPRLRDRAALRRRRRVRLSPQGPHRRGRPARQGDPRGRVGWIDARPGRRERTHEPGPPHRWPRRRRRCAAGDGRRGQADQGDRRRHQVDARRRRGAGRGPVRAPGRRCLGRYRRSARSAQADAHRDHVARGTGRVALAPAADRCRRPHPSPRGPRRRQRAAQPDGADERHPRVLDDQRAHRSVADWPSS